MGTFLRVELRHKEKVDGAIRQGRVRREKRALGDTGQTWMQYRRVIFVTGRHLFVYLRRFYQGGSGPSLIKLQTFWFHVHAC